MAGLQRCTPTIEVQKFQDWWQLAEKMVPKLICGGLNSLISLVLWHLWKHRNTHVFEGMPPSVPRIILDISSEVDMWCMAGAKCLSSLALG
jgi:hypothetical protein